jgi:hypothetical protein
MPGLRTARQGLAGVCGKLIDPVIARSEATKQSIFLSAAKWIASLRSQ